MDNRMSRRKQGYSNLRSHSVIWAGEGVFGSFAEGCNETRRSSELDVPFGGGHLGEFAIQKS